MRVGFEYGSLFAQIRVQGNDMRYSSINEKPNLPDFMSALCSRRYSACIWDGGLSCWLNAGRVDGDVSHAIPDVCLDVKPKRLLDCLISQRFSNCQAGFQCG